MALRPKTTRADAYEILTDNPANPQAAYGRIEFQLVDRYAGSEGLDDQTESRRWTGSLHIEVHGRSPEQIHELIETALANARLE